MRTRTLKLFLTLTLIFVGGKMFAQDFGPEWGANATPEERRENVLTFNYYKDSYEAQRYDDALGYLPTLLANCPGAMQNIYVFAINIYKNKIARAKTIDERNVYVDSLMILYDMRIEYFGDNARYGRPYILKQKAKDYLLFRPTDREGIQNVFEDAIAANMHDQDYDFINVYFKELTEDFLNDDIETDFYLDSYEKLSDIMGDATSEAALTTFEALFMSSKAADCENLERILRARVEAYPDDVDVVSKAFTQLSRSKCDSPFFFEVAERYFKLEPSANAALQIAQAYEKSGDHRKSIEFLRAAVDNQSDPIEKATLCVQISGMELAANNPRVAAEFARMAMQYNPDNGNAHMFLAQAYSEGSSNCQDFERQTVYWLAYDSAVTARRIFSDNAEEAANASKLMSAFKQNFPTKEELFFRGLSEGASYDVRCGWISGRTTVKER